MKNIDEFTHLTWIDISSLIKSGWNTNDRKYFSNATLKNLSADLHLLRAPYPEFVFLFKGVHPKIDGKIMVMEEKETDDVRLSFYYQPDSPSRPSVISDFKYNKNQTADDLRFSFSAHWKDKQLPYNDINDQLRNNPTLFLMYALVLINCKNIIICDEPSADKKRKWNSMNRGKKQKIYKVLKIKRVLIKNKKEQESFDKGKTMPFHTVRFHFRTYTEDAPLFGKYIGTFAIEAHTRGDVANGQTIKDYYI